MSYYEKHAKFLADNIKEYRRKRQEIAEDLYRSAEGNLALLELIETSIMRYPMRPYQMDALYTLDALLRFPEAHPVYKDLLETIDRETKEKRPFLGFEMATGSGKTAVMGAAMYHLHKTRGIRNFLIITPASTDIYEKSIRNFSKGTAETVWGDDVHFNLVSGDNYQQSESLFDQDKDFSIFVFNISKFGKNAIRTSEAGESAAWKDSEENQVSIKQYLQNEPLVIIIDEAHHTQKSTSLNIIKAFRPDIILEFTATASESTKSRERRAQNIVYRYSIREFLEAGHGKLVRALALIDTEKSRARKTELPRVEKLKLITLLLVHMMKQESLDREGSRIKPLAFVKVKDDTKYARLVFEYLSEKVADEVEHLQFILGKIQTENYEIVHALRQLIQDRFSGDEEKIRKAFRGFAHRTIFYHGKSDTDTQRRYRNIRTNEVEIVVYMQRLDEGIDLPNIYSMAVINDTVTDARTHIKQIIGRGVRLPREKRLYDRSTDEWQRQTEMLHIICDPGRSFEELILSIQKEFGLNSLYLGMEHREVTVENEPRANLLDKLYFPRIKAQERVKKGVSLMGLVQDITKIVDEYCKHNCFQDGGELHLKFLPHSFFLETDVFAADFREQKREMQKRGDQDRQLNLNQRLIDDTYNTVQKILNCLPDTRAVRDCFTDYATELNARNIAYFYSDPADHLAARHRFVSTFSFFYRNYIEKHYFILNYDGPDEEEFGLAKSFVKETLKIPEDQRSLSRKTKKGTPIDILRHDYEKVKEMINAGYQFSGYENSLYPYVRFDSFPEFVAAETMDRIIGNSGNTKREFWVRNGRQVFFQYGGKRYYPDFLLHCSQRIFAVETKGEDFSENKKNLLLNRLNEQPLSGDYGGILLFENDTKALLKDDLYERIQLEGLLAISESNFGREQQLSYILREVEEKDKFRRYLPVYSLKAAAGKFSEAQEVHEDGWLRVPERIKGYTQDFFVAQVRGDSMEPRIPAGSYCIFQAGVGGSRQGLTVLVESREANDPENGGRYTVKVYRSEKIETPEELWKHERIILSPINNKHEPIILEKDAQRELKVIAVFHDILSVDSNSPP